MKKLSVQTFHEMLCVMKGIFRIVWGSSGIEGFTGPQFGLLMNLHRQGPLSPTELSDRMLVTRGNITGLIARLKKHGWVERRRSSTDRRILKIALSKAGLAKLESVIPIWEETISNSFQPLQEKELKALFATLEKLRKSLPEPHLHHLPTKKGTAVKEQKSLPQRRRGKELLP